MKRILFLILAGICGLVWAQTNTPAANPPKSQIVITSDTGSYDGNTREMIYLGHVFASDDPKAKMHCGQLTLDLPPDGGHPTNIVAETNVVIEVLDDKGETNIITADKAIYAYSVVDAVTNETVTFIGGQPVPKVENPQLTITGNPLVWNNVTKKFTGTDYQTTINPKAGNGTNAAPFDFLK